MVFYLFFFFHLSKNKIRIRNEPFCLFENLGTQSLCSWNLSVSMYLNKQIFEKQTRPAKTKFRFIERIFLLTIGLLAKKVYSSHSCYFVFFSFLYLRSRRFDCFFFVSNSNYYRSFSLFSDSCECLKYYNKNTKMRHASWKPYFISNRSYYFGNLWKRI